MKNTMSLENYGVVEMTTQEMKTTNGMLVWQNIQSGLMTLLTALMLAVERILII